VGGELEKALLSTIGDPAITTQVRLEQKEKAKGPMEVTEVGMVMEEREVQ
jgi:hypothetical protein